MPRLAANQIVSVLIWLTLLLGGNSLLPSLEGSPSYPETRIRVSAAKRLKSHQAARPANQECMRVLAFSYDGPASEFPLFGFRDYMPDIGRWTARDPIGIAGGLDVYAYCHQDPINLIDPDGLEVYTPALAAGGPMPAATAAQKWAAFGQAVTITGVATGAVGGVTFALGRPATALILTGAAAEAIAPGSGNGVANALQLPFKHGEIIMREFATTRGVVDMAAEVAIEGKLLHLKDIAVYPRGTEALTLGTRETLGFVKTLMAEAKALGFRQLRITGERLSGANPGKTVDITKDLGCP